MKTHTTIKLALAAGLITSAPGAQVLNYWDMSGTSPSDLVGGVTTTTGTNFNNTHNAFGAAPGSGGAYLKSPLGGAGIPLLADVHDGTNATALQFGTSDFSFSYWSWDDTTDGDVRGPRIFDFLGGTLTYGIQLGTNATNIYNLRIDDGTGGSYLSNTSTSPDNLTGLQMPGDQWVNVVVNVSRSTELAEIFFNGVSQGAFDISGTAGGKIEPSTDMQIGVINGGGTAGTTESAGLDDLAFYDGTLNSAEIAGLAAGTLTPDQIPEPSSALLIGLGALGLLRRRR